MGEHRHARATFTVALEDEILQRISDGEPLSHICGPARRLGMPDRSSVQKYIRENANFRSLYILARDAQALALAEEIVDIADGKKLEPGAAPSVGRDYLRVRARQWLTSVMKPRIYARKIDEVQECEDLYQEGLELGWAE